MLTPAPQHRPLLVYALYGGVLYGTERMGLATVQALAGAFEVCMLAPPGVVHAEAARLGVPMREYRGLFDLAKQIAAQLAHAPNLMLISTRLELSIVAWMVNLRSRGRISQRLVVHGGGGKNVYRRNLWLLLLPVGFIAVSDFVKRCLIDNGIPASRVVVAENFLTDRQVAATPRRAPFTSAGVQRVVVVSRLEPVKHVGLLLDALDREPRLARMQFDIYGDGRQLETLRARAARHTHVHFHGFVGDVIERVGHHDLLLHTAPSEPFGLVILEAMAADVPTLVPDRGGPAAIVLDQVTGWHYRADDACDLARRLLEIQGLPPAALTSVVVAARQRLLHCYGETTAAARYRALLVDPGAP
jgi:glycosyltransferase involved in cell wall biosynthesis